MKLHGACSLTPLPMNAEISSVTIGQETLCPDAEKVLSNNDGLSVGFLCCFTKEW